MMRQPISVLHLISSLQIGGAERLLVDFVEATRDDDRINLIVVVMNQAINKSLKQRLERTGVSVYYLNRPESHLHYQYALTLLQILHRHDVQIIHSHNSGSKIWSILCKLLMPHLKLVFTVHDTVPAHYSRSQRLIHRLFIDQHIAISKAVYALCQRETLLPVEMIYNGIPVAQYRQLGRLSLKERFQKVPFTQKPLQILQISRFQHEKKGQDLLLAALRLCRNEGMHVEVTLMGGVQAYNQASYEHLLSMVEALNLKEFVHFCVNQTNVAEQLSKADVFILPSRYEGFGLVLLEAMSAGVPVIATRIDGPAELITHEKDGLFIESNSSQALFEAISRLYYNPEFADRLSQEASKTVQRFDIQRLKIDYYQCYENLTPQYNQQKPSLAKEAAYAYKGDLS